MDEENNQTSNEDQIKQMIDNGYSRNEIMQELRRQNEEVFDIGNLPDIKHNWVRRGIVISCEGAGHPNHRHFLFKPKKH